MGRQPFLIRYSHNDVPVPQAFASDHRKNLRGKYVLVSDDELIVATVLIWGGVMMAQAAPTNAAGLLVGRYFLGLAEGSAYPAAIVLISIWYRKAEHAARFAALYGADIIAQGIGGMMLFGFSSIQGPIAGWRIAMIIAGCMTIVIGTLFAWLIPSKIETAWFLNERDREIAVRRVAAEHASAESRVWDWEQFWETVKDPRVCLSPTLSMTSLIPLALHVLPLGLRHRRLHSAELWYLDPERSGICESSI